MADPDRLAALRREYLRAGLDERDVDADPLVQVRRWLEGAVAAGLTDPSAMVLATAAPDGTPSARTVLLKGIDERGFVLYTQRRSRKGTEMLANPRASLVLPWFEIDRQVVVDGDVEEVDRATTLAYFASRPRGARLSAWASEQSAVVPGRAALDAAWEAAAARWPEGIEVPLPDHWGGFRVVPRTVELWQGRASRLHDRLRYRRDGAAGWLLERLAP